MPAVDTASLENATVVVIGGGSGIGFAVAAGAAAEGASVVIGSTDERKLATAAERLPGSTRALQIDVTSEPSVARFFAQIGSFDHLVFTSGNWDVAPIGSPAEADISHLNAAMAVRFFGAVRAVKYGCRSIAATGSITLTSGALAYRPHKGMWGWSPVAGALSTLAAGLAVELAPVRVNVVSPGVIVSADEEGTASNGMHRSVGHILSRLPSHRSGLPAEAAQAYLYSMKGSYTTGQEIRVDGGYSVV
jgi:NAD(P)-dependent dehydrogenase (short-subunit alcohol dehydrogenase family)